MRLFGKEIILSHNDKIALRNITGAFLVKGFSLLVSFISLPLYIKFFNDDIILGLWFTLLSVLTWLLTFDFGIGNGLRNKLVKAIAKNDKELVKTYISSAYAYLGFIVVGFIIIITPIILIMNWGNILNITSSDLSSKVLLYVVLINYFTVVLQFFLRLITFILYALQKSAINNLLILITTMSQLVFILVYKGENTTHNLIVLSYVHMACVILPLLITTYVVFSKRLKDSVPSFKNVNFRVGKDIISLGGQFFLIQIMYLGLTGSNAFFIANIIGPQEVVEYQIYFRIYTLVAMLVSLALTPFWSLITKAKVENDWKWIKRYFSYIPLVLVAVGFGQTTLVLLNGWIFKIWLGDSYITPLLNYGLIFASFGILYSIQAIISTFANGFNRIRNQLVLFTVGLIFKISILYGFTDYIENWSIIVIVDIIVFTVYCVVDFTAIYRYVNRKSKEKLIVEATILDFKTNGSYS